MFKSAIEFVHKKASAAASSAEARQSASRASRDEPRQEQMFRTAIASVQKAAAASASAETRQPAEKAPQAEPSGSEELLGKFLTEMRHGAPPGTWNGPVGRPSARDSGDNELHKQRVVKLQPRPLQPPAAWLGA